MLKRWASFILIAAMLLSTTVVFAEQQPSYQVYNITVTEAGGKFQLGNVELTFKKDSLQKGMQPVVFTVAFYAEDGVPYIDIEPSVESFTKDVAIKVHKGAVEFYDVAAGKQVLVQLENYNFKVEHFSRYILLD